MIDFILVRYFAILDRVFLVVKAVNFVKIFFSGVPFSLDARLFRYFF